jgi:hypothetical protein
MIGQVVRGNRMVDLISYLFGRGKDNEHVNQHLVAGYANAVFTADDRLWQDEPGTQKSLRNEARTLGWQVDYPHSRWQTEIKDGYVWHCSLSISRDEGELTDAQWSEAAHEIVKALGFDGADGKAPCRWVAVRHGLSQNGNDHIHIAVNLVREDGTRASPWKDFAKLSRACSALEDRFGLRKVEGRMTGRSLPEPSRADAEISAARGDPEPLRIRLERRVRACAAVATSEDHFTRLARAQGLLVRPRYATDGATITGYAFADTSARTSAKTGSPIWFGGGKLAPDLTAGRLRERWDTGSRDPVQRAADAAAVAATTIEADHPGSVSRAARHMARAAQAEAVITGMASTFLAVTAAGTTRSPMALVHETAALIDACMASAASRSARRDITTASTLVHASAQTMARQADQQAAHALTQGNTMTELSHEEELITHLTQAGVLSAQLARALLGHPGTGGGGDIAALKAAGYTEQTPWDGYLRELFGEQRWAKYTADPARIVGAAAMTDADRVGHDMHALLTTVFIERGWENDPYDAARSIARILAYRITKEIGSDPTSRRSRSATPARSKPGSSITTRQTADKHPDPHLKEKPPRTTPYDAKLRELLGESRWREYAGDQRRDDVAEMIIQAQARGHDVDALLTDAVTCRPFEDDPDSPARRVAGVLHHRIRTRLARASFPDTAGSALAQATAPPAARPASDAQDEQAPPRTISQHRTDERHPRSLNVKPRR